MIIKIIAFCSQALEIKAYPKIFWCHLQFPAGPQVYHAISLVQLSRSSSAQPIEGNEMNSIQVAKMESR